jgi:hypothetical protein
VAQGGEADVTLLRHWAGLAALALLSACGGGGGDPAPAAPSSTVAGLYFGTADPNGTRFFDALLLSNGRMYGMLGTGAALQKVFLGTGTLTATGFNSTAGAILDTQSGVTTTSGAVTLTGTPKTSIAGSVTGTGVAATFTSSYNTGFEGTASLANLTGVYGGIFAGLEFGGAGLTLTVNAAGAFSGTGSGCPHTGTLTPNSGANVYDVSITFGPGCPRIGQMTGHARLQPATLTAAATLTMFAVNNAYSDAWIFFGPKQP